MLLEPLQNGGRKFNLSWLGGFSLGLDRDSQVFHGTSASGLLVTGPQKTTGNHLVLATVKVYFLSAERMPCSPSSRQWQSQKRPSSQVHTHCSLTHSLVTWMLSSQNASSDHPHLPVPPSSSVPQGYKMVLGFYRTCLVRECIYQNSLANCGESQDNKSEETGKSWSVQKKWKWHSEGHHFSKEGCVLCWGSMADRMRCGKQTMAGPEKHQEINDAAICLSGLIWQKRRQQYFKGRFRANGKSAFWLETDAEEKLPLWNTFSP